MIIFLLLLGPAPISVALFALGDGPAALAMVLTATAALIGAMLELYRRQRRDAQQCDLPVLPKLQVAALLLILAGIGLGTFFLPITDLAPIGLAALTLALALIFGFAIKIRRDLEEPDERGALLMLALMACLIALGNACL